MRLGHTGCHPGKRVMVILRDGTRFVDKFVERTKTQVVFENHTVHKGLIRVFSLYNGRIANLRHEVS